MPKRADEGVVDPTAVLVPTPIDDPTFDLEELECIASGGMWDYYEQSCDHEWHDETDDEEAPVPVDDPLAGLDDILADLTDPLAGLDDPLADLTDPLADLDSEFIAALNAAMKDTCLSDDVDGVWIDGTGPQSTMCLIYEDVLCPDTGCFDTLSATCGSMMVCDDHRPEPSPLLELVKGYDISFDFGITISESEEQ